MINLSSLEEMTNEGLTNRPEQGNEALEEYLDKNLTVENPEKAKKIWEKIKTNPTYEKLFKTAITQTSLIIFIMSAKSAEENEESINFNKYKREYLSFAKDDDKDIYDMRLYYLDGLSGENLGLTNLDKDDFETIDDYKAALTQVTNQCKKYDTIRNLLITEYKEIKSYLNK